MSLQTDLFTLLQGLVSDRVYPSGTAATTTPYITYQRITAIEQTSLDTNGGTGNLYNTIMQIDVWASSYGAAQTLAESVKTALKGWSNQNVVQSELDEYEQDTKLHRVLLDVSIWHS